ncbi:hypothetical protein QQS21_012888 [Conoideocrella luteorostrata]|uniref:Pentatricopeptide repeat domain-containing protein n=1 Tax=Conoideocrella luteorostrata TaxID=1105319 RepID=A0AAJ0FMA5_9HYPO|nr:hypothetical protein QQS21_012888 [Conoideocrella luteorostrata]
MQSLWSRAGQAHRCGCRACSTAIGAAGRRAAGASGRRKATFAEIFTACYSSVFAAAAVADAVHKDDRRKQLDRKLEESRKELAELQERSSIPSTAEANTSCLSIEQMDSLWQSLKTIYQDRPFMKEIHKPATTSTSELVSKLKAELYNVAGEDSLRAMRQTDYEQLERAIEAEESDSQISFRQPQNQAQLLRDSTSIEHLVQQLLRRAELLDNGSSQSPSFDEARKMAASGCTDFTFQSIDPDRAARNTSALNNQIRTLISASNLSLKERIGRVCYNLLVSAYPPDMHTYNTLVVAFDKSGHHAFSDALVHSFFHQRKLKPTPSTFTAILNHYKLTNNHGKFLRALSCLTGADKMTGGKMRRRHIRDIEQQPVLQRWAADTKWRTLTGDWVWEHVPLNIALVETILRGLLHFHLYDSAASFFLTCMRAGVGLSTRAITHVFDECLTALDWRAGVRLVQGLTDSLRMWEALLSKEDDITASYLVGRTFALLDLCGLSNYDRNASKQTLASLGLSGPKFRRLLKSMAKTNLLPPDMYSDWFQAGDRGGAANDTTRSKSRLLQIESLWKEYEFVRKTTTSLESKLLSPQHPSLFRTSMALHIGAEAIQKSFQLCNEAKDALPLNENLSIEPQESSLDRDTVHNDSLHEKLESLIMSDGQIDTRQDPSPKEPVAVSMATIGWTTKQDRTVPEGLRFKPRGILTWPRPTSRDRHSESRQWAMGS